MDFGFWILVLGFLGWVLGSGCPASVGGGGEGDARVGSQAGGGWGGFQGSKKRVGGGTRYDKLMLLSIYSMSFDYIELTNKLTVWISDFDFSMLYVTRKMSWFRIQGVILGA